MSSYLYSTSHVHTTATHHHPSSTHPPPPTIYHHPLSTTTHNHPPSTASHYLPPPATHYLPTPHTNCDRQQLPATATLPAATLPLPLFSTTTKCWGHLIYEQMGGGGGIFTTFSQTRLDGLQFSVTNLIITFWKFLGTKWYLKYELPHPPYLP